MSVGRLRWTWRSRSSTACWSWDARPTSASPEPRQGWGNCARIPDPCTTAPMAASLYGSARATPRVRAELQRSQEATRALATRYGSNSNTVQKWRKRTTADQPMGPSRPCSAVPTEVKKAIITKFRRRTLLPLDNVLGCLHESIPKLSHRALHRCLVRRGLPRLPKDEENASKRLRI